MRDIFLVIASILLALFQASESWTIPRKELKKAASIASIASIAAAICSSPLVADAVDFSGSYSDPFHPNCARLIKSQGQKLVLSGTDGNPGCPPDGSGNEWTLTGQKVGDNKILVDFSPKGGPSDLEGAWEGGDSPGIRWPDGNKWSLKH